MISPSTVDPAPAQHCREESEEALLPESAASDSEIRGRLRLLGVLAAVAGFGVVAIVATFGVSVPRARVDGHSAVQLDEDTFDCKAGVANWQKGWSGMKKQWCCSNKHVACTPEAGSDDSPFDCTAGVNNWDAGWAIPKKIWCCQNKGVKCEKPNILKVTWVFGNIDYSALRASGGLSTAFEHSCSQTLVTTLHRYGVKRDNITIAFWAGSALHSTGKTRHTGVVVRATILLADARDHQESGFLLEAPLFAMRASRGIQGVVSSITTSIPGCHDVTVEPQISSPCTCENGDPAQYPVCGKGGGHKCGSCTHGFHLTSTHRCEENKCTCHGGVAAKGDTCPTHLKPKCISCFSGRHYEPEKKMCIANECTCAMGYAAAGPPCSQHHAAICGDCYPGYDIDEGTKECVPKECVCPDGDPVDTTECPQHGALKCKSCSAGFHVDPKHFTCKINVCHCKRGKKAVGPNCLVHESEMCASCEQDLFLHQGRCSGDKMCNCPNGTAVQGKKCTTNFATICTRCDTGFTLYHDQCIAARCVCENGVAADSKLCTTQGAAACQECHDGYHLDGGKCVARQCQCSNGVGAKGKQCASEGAHSCSECNPGYRQKLRTIEDKERGITRLAVTCEANRCTCEDHDGHPVGIPAAGAHQSKCSHDGRQICIQCNSHYTGPNSKQQCVANACRCYHGDPVGVKDCRKNDQLKCGKCHSGYWLASDDDWVQDPSFTGAQDKKHYTDVWKQGGAPCLPKAMTSSKPFDCQAAQMNWELAWSPMKQRWCCQHEKIGCIPTLPAKDACEDKGFTKEQCAAVGCCSYVSGKCVARKGWEKDVCNPDFRILVQKSGQCLSHKPDPANPTSNTDRLVIRASCHTGDTRQAWRPNSEGQVHNGGGLCFSVATATARQDVKTAKCDSPAVQKQFTYIQSDKAFRLFEGQSDTHLCISLSTTDDQLRLAGCNSAVQDQQFAVSVMQY